MKKIFSGSLSADEKGFTLIELSIVLVIIGLIVGGILVGQDLIKGAEIRATIAQLEKYNTAVNTFRNKYGAIPGDIPVSTASSFGLFSLMSGAAGYGDGNGLIEGGTTGSVSQVGETVAFWRHLSDAGEVDGTFGASLAAGGVFSCSSSGACNSYLPFAKLGRGNMILATSSNGINYFDIAGISSLTSGAFTTSSNNLTPQEAYNIDRKTDDGLPTSGTIMALDGSNANIATQLVTPGTNTSCINNSAYYLTGTYGTTQACSLRLKFN